ncbi:uncharacterized protein LOC123475651 [Daphnia magna]|uniref:uncharacterized protein LOC123475651 n=1 Tax=Daphnia magna TaxID=35525 RepID=UPI001E1BA2A6|nr:uncharacterized protein LOC123475651 [Daphnia magna]
MIAQDCPKRKWVGRICEQSRLVDLRNHKRKQQGRRPLLSVTVDVQKPMTDFKEFWSLEHMGITQQEKSEPEVLEAYQDTIQRTDDGRYMVLFPIKIGYRRIESNRNIGLIRLRGLLAKTQLEYKLKYHEIFQQYLRDGFTEEVDREFVGPNLNPEVFAVLLRFRPNRISWTADITQAFLQVGIRLEHGQFIRFFWIYDLRRAEPRLIEYRWKRMPFGLSCSPFILKAVILKHLKYFEKEYPKTVRQLQQQLYVDDWLEGEMSVEEAEKSIREENTIFEAAKIELCKWTANSAELVERLPEIQLKETFTSVAAENKSATKTLGVIKDPAPDKFRSGESS